MRTVGLAAVCLAFVAGCTAVAPEPTPGERAKNVILFVGDGMGIATVTAARIFDGQSHGRSGEENSLSFEHFPNVALSKTYSFDAQVSESAATMTAMMSGVKTRSVAIGLDSKMRPGDCESVAGSTVATLLEQAETRGLATGVVTTTRVTHATPAATYAHSPHRNWEFDGMVPKEARKCMDIARQLVEFKRGDGIDVVLGGGQALFLPTGAGGVRRDGRDLLSRWQRRYPDGRVVGTASELEAAMTEGVTRIFGLFNADHLQFEHDRVVNQADEPSLATMTADAIRVLARDPDGFFLVVEAGRIDHAHHFGNAYRALGEAVQLSEAVGLAVQLTSVEDTLILVTADHSHTLTIAGIGYPTRGNPILGLADERGKLVPDGAGRPFTTLSYANGPGAHAASDTQPAGAKHFPHEPTSFTHQATARADLTRVDTTGPDYLQEAGVPLTLETHAGEDVPVYARGPGASQAHGVIEQNEIYHIMRRAFGW